MTFTEYPRTKAFFARLWQAMPERLGLRKTEKSRVKTSRSRRF